MSVQNDFFKNTSLTIFLTTNLSEDGEICRNQTFRLARVEAVKRLDVAETAEAQARGSVQEVREGDGGQPRKRTCSLYKAQPNPDSKPLKARLACGLKPKCGLL